MGQCLLLPHRPDQPSCSSFVRWLLVLPPVNKPFWFAVDCVKQQISTFGGAVSELFPTTAFVFLIPTEHRVDSFISRPFSSASHGAVATLCPETSSSLPLSSFSFPLSNQSGTYCLAGWVSVVHTVIGSSHPRSLPTFPSLIGRHCRGGQRRSKGLWDM